MLDRRLVPSKNDVLGYWWVIGNIIDITSGYLGELYSDQFVECPTDTITWENWIDKEWTPNLNAKLTDYGKWPKYSGSFLRYF